MGTWEARAMNGWGFPGRLRGPGRPEGPDKALGTSSPRGQMGKKEGAEEGDSLEGVATPCPLSQPDGYCPLSQPDGYCAMSHLLWARVANVGFYCGQNERTQLFQDYMPDELSNLPFEIIFFNDQILSHIPDGSYCWKWDFREYRSL